MTLLAVRSLRIAPGSSRFAQGPGESARPVTNRLHTLAEHPGREPSCSLPSTATQGGAQVHGRTRLPGRVTRALRPQPLGKGRDGSGGLQEAVPGSEPAAPGQSRAASPGRTQKGRREKGCSSGAGPVGEGDPARTLTHRLVRLLARAPRLAPLRCQPLTYPPEPQRPVRLHQDGERSARAEGAWRARTRGWGGWDGGSRRRGHRRHDRCRLHSATEATGPPTTLGPASAPPPPGSDSRIDQSET